ncbi:MAG: mandelate racemase/muconate lactonizing enzyme family protein [Rhodomicrobiaceae bacterium]
MAAILPSTIADVRIEAYRVPLVRPWVSAAHAITHHEHILTTITLENGTTGTGFSSTMGVGGIAVAALARSYLAPLCIGRDVFDHENLWWTLWRRCHQPGANGIGALAVTGFDLALWDLRGKLLDVPVRKLIGGAATTVPVYASGVNLHLSEDELVEQTRSFRDAEYKLFKIKVGRPYPAEDVSRVAAIRAVIGDAPLMLDANQGWKPGEAQRRIAMFERVDPVWMEEPMASDDADSHARLAEQSRIPIALGETLSTRFEFWRYISSKAVSYLQPNVLKVGGISEWLKIAHLGMTANLTIAPHGVLETSAILATAIPGCYPVENIDGGAFTDQGILEEPVTIENGLLTLPERPGLGITFDRSAMERHKVDAETVVAPVDPKRFYKDNDKQ